MKKYLLLLFHFAPKKIGMTLCVTMSILNCAFSQGGEWTWISGDSSLGSLGVYGTQGIPSINNHPPGVYEPCEWKDKQGNLWLYGGYTTSVEFSDLWKYTPATNEWTWVKGNGLPGQGPAYGTQGVPNINNNPGSRIWTVSSWVDTTGNLWLFGGGNWKNDLWRYDISSNEWTWMSGSTQTNAHGHHGYQGVSDPLNIPGGRAETCSNWTDSLNNLWLYGGHGYDDTGLFGRLSDLWKYSISTNEWTWKKGSATINATPNYGIKGTASMSNEPGGRFTHTKWKDSQNNFWIVGGLSNSGMLTDIWKYDLNINQWTWMGGSTSAYDPGYYQTMCVFDSMELPMSRTEQRSAVTDCCGNFWLFGGSVTGLRNDLWIFNPSQLKWNWISGPNLSNQSGNYGIKGITSSTNMPPARAGAVSWWGNDNKFYLFGGTQIPGTAGGTCDLWVFSPDTNCISLCWLPPISECIATNTLCPGTCTDFENLSSNATSYQWSFPGAIPDTSTALNPINICYANPGSYDVQLIASNVNGSDTLLLSNYITVFPTPLPQSITQSMDTLFANPAAPYYQWYYNGNIISGATDYFYVAQSSGDYNVIVTDSNGCEVEAVINNVIAGLTPPLYKGEGVVVFPNPVGETLSVIGYQLSGIAAEISVYNMMGEKIIDTSSLSFREWPGGEAMWTVDCRPLTSGMYYIEINTDNKIFRSKFLKQ